MRTFGGSRGGGGGMGGEMIRGVKRAIRAGVGGVHKEPFSPSSSSTTIAKPNSRNTKQFNRKRPISPNTALTLSSCSSPSSNGNNSNEAQPFSSLINFPASGAYTPAWGHGSSGDESEWDWEWECVDGIEDGRAACVFHEDIVYGTVPSRVEVEHAVSALQQVFGPSSYAWSAKGDIAEDSIDVDGVANPVIKTQTDWIEPSHYQRRLQPQVSDTVHEVLHLLQTEPSIQRMVISLSSDKALWDAVLNNEVVQEEYRASLGQGDDNESSVKGVPNDSNPLKDIVNWIAANISRLIERFSKLVNDVFQLPEKKKGDNADQFESRLRTSMLLMIVVVLFVVVTRVRGA